MSAVVDGGGEAVPAVSVPAGSVFAATGLSVSYGGVHALSDFTMSLGEKQLVGLIGPNGAGKTTFIDAASGFARSRGNVFLDGADISKLSPDRRARRGLGRTWQSIELFDELSVLENLTVAASRPPFKTALRDMLSGSPSRTPAVDRAIELLSLQELLEKSPSDLAQGQRKIVGVARALAAEPRVILLDEPAASLDAFESRELGRHLRTVVDAGIPMLLIDHDMGLVLSVCDYVYVLDFGRLIAEGTPQEVRTNPIVVQAYLGRAADDFAQETSGT
jgi:branched-chain amino acid transport system ATP-binding protein